MSTPARDTNNPSKDLRETWVYVTANLILGGGDQILLTHAHALAASPYRMVLFSLEPFDAATSLATELRALGVEIRSSSRTDHRVVRLAAAAASARAALRAGLKSLLRRCHLKSAASAARDEWKRIWPALTTKATIRLQQATLRASVGNYLRSHHPVGLHVLHASACLALGDVAGSGGVPAVYTEILTPHSYHSSEMDLSRSLAGYSEIVVPATTIAHHLQETYGLEQPFRVIPFTVEVETTPQAMRHRPDRFHIGIIARLSEEKRHADLLRAFARVRVRCPEAMLVIAGDGPLRGELEHLADELSVRQNVCFKGAFRPPELAQMLDEMDVVVLPSRTEGMPHVLLEAMAFGKPVVATPVGSVPEMIEDGRNGFLVPVGDIEALSERITQLLLDCELRRRMGRQGQIVFEQRYDQVVVFDKIRALCGDVARNSAKH